MIRSALLSVHLLSIIAWIGVGFFELYLGRRFLASRGSPIEAPLIRIVYTADLVVAAATVLAFVTGIAMTLYEGQGFFSLLWLGTKQAIMIIVVIVVIAISPTAMKLNAAVSALPAGPGPATDEIRGFYRRLEPWHGLMRVLAVCAVLLAVWRPLSL
ncbi:MAG TPA: hypothetical protein VGI30_08145 [Caulobacteraceae bacterium]